MRQPSALRRKPHIEDALAQWTVQGRTNLPPVDRQLAGLYLSNCLPFLAAPRNEKQNMKLESRGEDAHQIGKKTRHIVGYSYHLDTRSAFPVEQLETSRHNHFRQKRDL